MLYLEAFLESLADDIQSDRVDAGVDRGHVEAKVVQHEEDTGEKGRVKIWAEADRVHSFLT